MALLLHSNPRKMPITLKCWIYNVYAYNLLRYNVGTNTTILVYTIYTYMVFSWDTGSDHITSLLV